MLNFAVGPVLSEESILKVRSQQLPYFRTEEFSEINRENEKLFLELVEAPEGSKAIFITGSGTASMEAAVINVFNENDKLLIVNGGGFGRRFCEICSVHNIPYDEIVLDAGKTLTKEKLEEYPGDKYTGLLVNMNETSTGVLYDVEMIGEYCKKYALILVVDAVSAFLADELCMEKWGIDLVFTGSQKALALPPGLSIMAMSPRTVKRVCAKETRSFYFNLKEYLKDGERGQTPFTPAVGIILQLNLRLRQIQEKGIQKEREKIKSIADDFRIRIKDMPLQIFSDSLSNAVTPLQPLNGMSAHYIFEKMKKEFDIYVCPNGGELSDKVFRVGHIGNLKIDDNIKLVNALKTVMGV